MRLLLAAAIAWCAVTATAAAEVVSATPERAELRFTAEFNASPSEVWRAIGRVDRWWNGEHTYSGDARRLRLDLAAPGCFCERWSGGAVEHMRVVMAIPGQTLRLTGGLGPLQTSPLNGVMTYSLAPAGAGARLTLTYTLAGQPADGLEALAPLVDQVIGEQFARLASFTRTGAPTP